jgi:hypothetical protein
MSPIYKFSKTHLYVGTVKNTIFIHLCAILVSIIICQNNCHAQGVFFKEYWAEFNPRVSNQEDGRWRVND